MKRALIILILLLLTGCSKNEVHKTNIIVPNGTPFVAIGNVSDVNITNINGPDLLSAAFVNLDNPYDVIIAPVNLGAKLYIMGSSDYKLAAVITTNNNYIVSRKPITSISDLEAKTIMAYGMNNTPGIALEKALDDNFVNAFIDYKSSVMDIIPFFVNDNSSTPEYILSSEPTLSNLALQYGLSNLYILDLASVLSNDFLQAGIFVNPNSNVTDVLERIKNNITYLNTNTASYSAALVEKNVYFQTLGINLLNTSIPNSSISYISAKENITMIEDYFNILNAYNTNLLNGVVPNENFYY